jgi:SulP family sulfate permease
MATPRLRQLKRFDLPLLHTLKTYQRAWLRDDVVAGLTVCLVMIPSVIAYAELLNLPPVTGLYAALAASLGYALFASSRHVIAGPDAAICLLAGTSIAPLAGGDVVRTAVLAAELALLSGGVLLLAARLHLGAMADLLSRPVLIGYLNGASLVLVSTQLGKLFGLNLGGEDFLLILHGLFLQLDATHWPTLVLGLVLIGVLVWLGWRAPRVPGALAVSALAIAVALVVDLQAAGVAMVGTVPRGLPLPTLPAAVLADITALAPAAVAIAFLTFSDGILLAQTFADKNRYEVDANQELVALGVGNLVAGVLQGFPVSASQSRSAVVDAAGGRTQVAQLVAAAGLLLFLLLFTGLIALLPKVALGAILIVTALRMLEVASLAQLYRIDRKDFWLALVVMASILVAGVVPGIILGMLLSLIGVLVEISRPRDAVLSRLTRDGKFHDLDQNEPDAETIPGLLVYRLYAPLIFANARHVIGRLRELVDAADPALNWVIIDAQAITDMDLTAAQRFGELCRDLADEGIAIKIADVPRPFREEILRIGLSDVLGEDAFYLSVKVAVEAYQRHHPHLAARPLHPNATVAPHKDGP